MNELTVYQGNLPANIEDLARFALVGREKMVAVRAEIRAIDKLGLAEEVRRQKLEEGQMISEAVLDAEVRIGTLTSALPKATKGNQHTGKMVSDTAVADQKPKQEAIKELGFTPKQVERFETMAKHPEIVEQAKAEARENDDIVSRSAVLQKIKESKSPHIAHNSGNNEWYTPAEYIEAARAVMGSIDLDPASSDIAQKIVQAKTYYTINDDGLRREWQGRVWLNPPYSSDLIPKFISKLVKSVEGGTVNEAIVLVNNATETTWFCRLIGVAAAVVFPRGRVKYYTPDGTAGAPLQGQAVIYIGSNANGFMGTFNSFGWRCLLERRKRENS